MTFAPDVHADAVTAIQAARESRDAVFRRTTVGTVREDADWVISRRATYVRVHQAEDGASAWILVQGTDEHWSWQEMHAVG